MRLTMKERWSVVRIVASRYQKGSKKHKGSILKKFTSEIPGTPYLSTVKL